MVWLIHSRRASEGSQSPPRDTSPAAKNAESKTGSRQRGRPSQECHQDDGQGEPARRNSEEPEPANLEPPSPSVPHNLSYKEEDEDVSRRRSSFSIARENSLNDPSSFREEFDDHPVQHVPHHQSSHGLLVSSGALQQALEGSDNEDEEGEPQRKKASAAEEQPSLRTGAQQRGNSPPNSPPPIPGDGKRKLPPRHIAMEGSSIEARAHTMSVPSPMAAPTSPPHSPVKGRPPLLGSVSSTTTTQTGEAKQHRQHSPPRVPPPAVNCDFKGVPDDEEDRQARTPEEAARSPGWKRLDIKLKDLEPLDVIGRGYYATVRLVRWKKAPPPRMAEVSFDPAVAHDLFALKVVDRDRCNESYLANEITTMHTLGNHRFHTRLYNAFRSPSRLYMLLEYAPNRSLHNHIEPGVGLKDSRLPRYYTANIIIALKHLHEHSICHRDIKSGNLLIGPDFRIKVCDYGFARHLPMGERSASLAGTLSYNSPEQLLGYEYDHSVDIWALGVTVYEMLFGLLPFQVPENSSRSAGRPHRESLTSEDDDDTEDSEETFELRAASAIFDGVQFPESHRIDPACTPQARKFIIDLLQYFWHQRLGADLDYHRIMRQDWFQGFDWNAMERGTLPVPGISPPDHHLA